jgi:hypothetical protein
LGLNNIFWEKKGQPSSGGLIKIGLLLKKRERIAFISLNRMWMKKEITVQNRTWYGVNVTVIIGPTFLHKAGWGSLLIPHPPVVNWLLRKDLMDKARDALCVKHEIGHFETLPFGHALYGGKRSYNLCRGQCQFDKNCFHIN